MALPSSFNNNENVTFEDDDPDFDLIQIPEVVTMHEDFLKTDPKAKIYKNVKCILFDPSCSGSGIIDNPDRLLNPVDIKKDQVATIMK